MASAIANIVGKRILKESAQNHFGQEVQFPHYVLRHY